MLSLFAPSPTLTEHDVSRSLRLMVWEGVMSGAMFALGSGGIMAGFALALGANNLQIGLLAALPFVTQVAQLPSILAVERFRRRKALGVPFILVAQLLWLPMAAVPFFLDTPGSAAVFAVIILIGVRGVLAATWTTAWSSWMRDLVPRDILGRYYGRRLAIITIAVAAVGLGGSFFVDWWEGQSSPENAILAYSFLLIAGTLTFGLIGPFLSLRASEPLMPAAPQSESSALSILSEPLRDRNYQQLLKFLFTWSFASNLAIPFFAVYMLTQLDMSLPIVVGLAVLGQLAGVVFLRVWGPMADRFGLKTVLSLSASLYLFVILAWTFTGVSDSYEFNLALIVLLHLFAGVAFAGVTLTVGALSLKLAPDDKATAFVGIAGFVTFFGTGVGAIVGGLLSDFFLSRSLELQLNWSAPTESFMWSAPSVAGFDFLFIIAFIVGLLSLNLLVALREEGEIPRDLALAELTSRFNPTMRAVSSVPGLGVASALSYGYLKRVPGVDVALGVTAYQVAASAQAAVESAARGRTLAGDVAQRVGGALESTMDNIEDVTDVGLDLTRQAARGAMHAGGQAAERLEDVAKASVLGGVRAAVGKRIRPDEALRGAAYGIVEGAIEAGTDPGAAADLAVEAAREVASELHLSEQEAIQLASHAALDAAASESSEASDIVRQVLPDDVD